MIVASPPPARAALVVALVWLSGCTLPFTCPARGGPPWHEVETPNLFVQTDLEERNAIEFAQQVESLFEIVRAGLFQKPPLMPGKLEVVAFRNRDEFRAFSPPEAAAFYYQGSIRGPMIVLNAGRFERDTREKIAHELTHHVLFLAFPRQPLWFAEGLATYMQSVGTEGSWWLQPTLGGAPHHVSLPYPTAHSVQRMLVSESFGPADYANSWLLVHYLLNNEQVRFSQIQRRFGQSEDPAAAWKATFPEWDPGQPRGMAALASVLNQYLDSGRYVYREVRPLPPPQVSVRPMTPSEVHAARLLVPRESADDGRGSGPRDPAVVAAVRAEEDEALAEDPGNVNALYGRAIAVPSEAPALAKRATEAHPDDPVAWLLLARVVPEGDGPARESALRSAVRVGPGNAMAHAELAGFLGRDRPSEALPLAIRAVALAPWHPAAHDVHAYVLGALGRCTEALAAKQRALSLLAAHRIAGADLTQEQRTVRCTERVPVPSAHDPAPESTPAAKPGPAPAHTSSPRPKTEKH